MCVHSYDKRPNSDLLTVFCQFCGGRGGGDVRYLQARKNVGVVGLPEITQLATVFFSIVSSKLFTDSPRIRLSVVANY
jgi:hypothetical protein